MLNTLTARLMLLTPPLAHVESVILSAEPGRRRNLADWVGIRMGVQEGFDLHLTHLGHDISIVKPRPFANLAVLEGALLSGEVSAVIVTSIAARSMVARHPGMGWRVQSGLAPHLHAAAVRFGQHELLRTISQIIEERLKSGEISNIFERTTGVVLPPLRQSF
jgi:ABC-type amino acid transport substrate-binding protein